MVWWDMKKKWAVRWTLTVVLVVAIWCDVKWALYAAVTLLILAAEGEQVIVDKAVDEMLRRK
jgi:hypothetical protein